MSLSVDDERKELLWEEREEVFILKLANEAEEKRLQHKVAGKRFKVKHKIFGSLSVLLPIVFTGLTQMEFEYIDTIGFMVSGVFSGICAFFQFAVLMERHLEYSEKYSEYHIAITAELAKPKSSRIACDVYMTRCELLFNGLNRSAPDV